MKQSLLLLLLSPNKITWQKIVTQIYTAKPAKRQYQYIFRSITVLQREPNLMPSLFLCYFFQIKIIQIENQSIKYLFWWLNDKSIVDIIICSRLFTFGTKAARWCTTACGRCRWVGVLSSPTSQYTHSSQRDFATFVALHKVQIRRSRLEIAKPELRDDGVEFGIAAELRDERIDMPLQTQLIRFEKRRDVHWVHSNLVEIQRYFILIINSTFLWRS